MPEIKSLTGVSFADIHQAFANAFSDYAEPWDKTVDEIQYMLERRGYNADLSFGTFENGGIVSFMLNGTCMWNGKLTAYDMGTGTVPEFRRQGLAEKIFNVVAKELKTAGIEQYLLEVIRVNTKAIDLYKKQRFETIRELDYYITTTGEISIQPANNMNIEFRITDHPDWNSFQGFWSFSPSWQNSIAAVNRKLKHFQIVGAYTNDELAGYGIIEKHTGDIPQLAVAEKFRRQGVATALFAELLKYIDTTVVRVLNADASYAPFRNFMKNIGVQPGYGQYEMLLAL